MLISNIEKMSIQPTVHPPIKHAKHQDRPATYHVCKVDTLSKHVTGNGRFRRSNPETLRKNSGVICRPGSVPQKHPVVKFLEHFEPEKRKNVFKGTFNSMPESRR